jgi:hypothetical protein
MMRTSRSVVRGDANTGPLRLPRERSQQKGSAPFVETYTYIFVLKGIVAAEKDCTMANLERELTIMRLEHLATLSEAAAIDAEASVDRMLELCAYLLGAAEAMRQRIEDLRDEEEVEKLSGSVVSVQ